jgi:RNA polymerase sigma factor (sigma-70 family)
MSMMLGIYPRKSFLKLGNRSTCFKVDLRSIRVCVVSRRTRRFPRAEIREQVNAALAKLSPEHRAVIVLKDLEALQCQEIAEVLNISIGTVTSRLFYARKKLHPC